MTYIIAAITILVSILAFQRTDLIEKLKFTPNIIANDRQYYRFLSHALIHGGIAHLLFNMLVLISFGAAVEQYFKAIWGGTGIYYYVVLYVGGVIISSAPSFFKHKENPYYSAVGASGAISAIVFASILFDPWNKIYFMFIPSGIPAFIFGGLYLVFSAYMAKRGGDNIGHDAHFWGAVFGFIFTILLKPTLFIRFTELIFNN
jgi:membrane associated rhomboid family serine protease